MRFSKKMEEAIRQAEERLVQSVEEDERQSERLRIAIRKILTGRPLEDYARKVSRFIEEGLEEADSMDKNSPKHRAEVAERAKLIVDLAYPP